MYLLYPKLPQKILTEQRQVTLRLDITRAAAINCKWEKYSTGIIKKQGFYRNASEFRG